MSVQSRPKPVIETDYVYLVHVETQLGSNFHCVGAGDRALGQSPIGLPRMMLEKVDDCPRALCVKSSETVTFS